MPSEHDLLPIREVTRLTGVNPVTLRAWERRYGLVVPQRTSKGHRLYSAEHVHCIRQILHWLNRGIAVSQVKPLLHASPNTKPPTQSDDWHVLHAQLIDSIAELAERRLDQQFNQAMALYPAATLCEQLILPLLEQLEVRWHGHNAARMEQVFFHSWLRSKLGVRVYHNNRQLSGAPMLLINASPLPFDPQLWLCAWLASDAGCPVEVFDWPLPPPELALAVQRLHPSSLVMCLNTVIDTRDVLRSLSVIDVPTLLVGSAVTVHQQALQDELTGLDPVRLLVSPLAVLKHLPT
ncbi:MerR family transcriptional regulator [Pseudomonas sp. MAFF212427]|uniref:MerR family transcriptional regulator n=1 Tax=Pseudomonas brassicae TaxID=2708063 RepID=A0A6B3NYM2_9PSED|nr:MerR family transcriptional regulator [Pseudomonas brassicae]NER65280.1 MerR family transcriptional regulator [Pseudomonas brassicae]